MSELVVPMRVDALCLDRAQAVTGPMADHEILPWFDGDRDHYSTVPFLGSAINAEPFAEHTHWLEAGVHLHWALPDGLTRGATHRAPERPIAVDDLWFSAVPDRWLVRRRATRDSVVADRVWLVESDFVHTETDPETGALRPATDRPDPRAIAYPHALGVSGRAPYLYLGRQIELDPASHEPLDPDTPFGLAANTLAHYTAPLTALGHGDPAFAAHYPSCRSVFGFHDPEPARNEINVPQARIYDVYGWYSDTGLDPLAAMVAAVEGDADAARALILRNADAVSEAFLRDAPEALRPADWKAAKQRAVQRRFGWDLTLAGGKAFPGSILCHASAWVTPGGDETEATVTTGGEVAIGSSAAEAGAAYLMRDKKHGSIDAGTEDQLVQSLAATDLSRHGPDLGAKLTEARHNEQFRAMPGHTIWVIRPREDGTTPGKTLGKTPGTDLDAGGRAGVTLPDDIAGALGRLNLLQRRYDRAVDQIDALRQELYSDWVHYMRAAYPEGDTDPFRVDLDQLRYTIERSRIAPLEALERATGHLYFGEDERGNQRVVDRHALPGPLVGTETGETFAARLPSGEVPTGLSFAGRDLLGGLQITSDSGDYGPMPGSAVVSGIELHRGERIVAVSGLWGVVAGQGAIAQLALESSFGRRFGPFGQRETGLAPFRFETPQHLRLIGFRGRIGDGQVTQLGPIYADPAARDGDPDYGAVTLAQDVVAQHAAVLQGMARHGAGDLVLGRTPGQRFFQPNDPVIALGGRDAQASPRHGADGGGVDGGEAAERRKSTKRFLKTYPVELLGGWQTGGPVQSRSPDKSNSIELLETFEFGKDPEHGTYSDGLDWHPVFLDWQAELQPLAEGAAGAGGARPPALRADFLETTQALSEERPEFDTTDSTRAASYDYISGRAILNAAATRLLAERIKALPAPLKTMVAPLPEPGDLPMILPLGGFHDQLLMRASEPQLPIADPVGLPVQKDFADRVARLVGGLHPLTPLPNSPFHPLRSGDILIQRLRVIDSFGRTREWRPDNLHATSRMRRSDDDLLDRAALPARFAQPARIAFRWLSAVNDALETNDHPASSPVCGWVMANELDREVVVYAGDGRLLGSIDTDARWHPAPGDRAAPRTPRDIADGHMERFVRWLTETDRAADLVDAFLDMIEAALERIDPVEGATQQARAMLVTRPLALVRAQIDLWARHHVAQDQSWRALRARMMGSEPETRGVEDMRVAVRLGESNQLNDGLCGYWLDDAPAAKTRGPLYTPTAYTGTAHPAIASLEDAALKAFPVKVSFGGAPVRVTMLMDPLSVVHATTGILPTKSIALPPDQVRRQLERLRVTFAAAPILSPPGAIEIPLPAEQGYAWSWLERDGAEDWREVPHHPSLAYGAFVQGFGSAGPALWQRLIALGRLRPAEHGGTAELVAAADGADPKRFDDLGLTPETVERGLLALSDAIADTRHHARLSARVEARDGWLQLRPVPAPAAAPGETTES